MTTLSCQWRKNSNFAKWFRKKCDRNWRGWRFISQRNFYTKEKLKINLFEILIIKLNRNQIEFTMHRLIWNSKRMRSFAVPNQSVHVIHNLISVWYNKIWKRFLCVVQLIRCLQSAERLASFGAHLIPPQHHSTMAEYQVIGLDPPTRHSIMPTNTSLLTHRSA